MSILFRFNWLTPLNEDGGGNAPLLYMPKHVTISFLDGYKETAADLADPTLTAAGFLTISVGDTVDGKKEQATGPINVALTNVRRAIEEGTNTAPADVPLYDVKSNVANQVGGLAAIAADNVGITLGTGILPKSNTVQFRARLNDAINALTEGLA